MANRHGLITGATGTGKTVTLQTLAEHFSSIGVPCFMSDVKGDLSGVSQPGGGNAKVAERVEMLKLEGFAYQGYPGHLVGSVRRQRPSGARHRIRHGTAAAGAHAGSERNPERRAESGVQGRRRQRPAAARPEGPARDARLRRRQRQAVHHRLRQRLDRLASAPSSAACWRWNRRAANRSSASRCSTSPT